MAKKAKSAKVQDASSNDKSLLKLEYLPNLGFKTIKQPKRYNNIRVSSVFLFDPATKGKDGDPYYIIGLRAYTAEQRKQMKKLVDKAVAKGKDFIKWEAINGLTLSTTISEDDVLSGKKELPEVRDEISVKFVRAEDMNGNPTFRAKNPKVEASVEAEEDNAWDEFRKNKSSKKSKKKDTVPFDLAEIDD